jgi:hypothetical protein|tara:strand:- start:526 stop:1023 length:498 start_codon:yes stop_codon:yes gene_type:complete
MTNKFFAKPILENRFWILESDGEKVGTICRQEDRRYMFSCSDGTRIFDTQQQLQKNFNGEWMWGSSISAPKEEKENEDNSVYDYPSKFKPYNMVFDVKRKLPLFNKSKKSKSLYCAGYYVIQFEKGWVRSYCPKLLTLDSYPFKGPFRTSLEMKTELSNANKRTY